MKWFTTKTAIELDNSSKVQQQGASSDSSVSSGSSMDLSVGQRVRAKYSHDSRQFKPAMVVRDEGERGLRLLFDGYEDTVVVPRSRIRGGQHTPKPAKPLSGVSFVLSKELAMALIGKGGEVSKRICSETGCRVSVLDLDSQRPHTYTYRVELQGDEAALGAARPMCHELVGMKMCQMHGGIRETAHPAAYAIDAAVYLWIPNDRRLVGSIIGAGGVHQEADSG
jgi:hypothetical protein